MYSIVLYQVLERFYFGVFGVRANWNFNRLVWRAEERSHSFMEIDHKFLRTDLLLTIYFIPSGVAPLNQPP